MAKNTASIVIVALLVICLLSSCAVEGKPVSGDPNDLLDLETSAQTIIFRPMFVYHLQQKRLALKLEKLRKLRAEKAAQAAANQLN